MKNSYKFSENSVFKKVNIRTYFSLYTLTGIIMKDHSYKKPEASEDTYSQPLGIYKLCGSCKLPFFCQDLENPDRAICGSCVSMSAKLFIFREFQKLREILEQTMEKYGSLNDRIAHLENSITQLQNKAEQYLAISTWTTLILKGVQSSTFLLYHLKPSYVWNKTRNIIHWKTIHCVTALVLCLLRCFTLKSHTLLTLCHSTSPLFITFITTMEGNYLIDPYVSSWPLTIPHCKPMFTLHPLFTYIKERSSQVTCTHVPYYPHNWLQPRFAYTSLCWKVL